jgi:hypothetical protein
VARRASAPPVACLTVDDIAYDPARHASTAPDGRPVPHVTAVLEATGLGTDFEELRALGPTMRERIELARLRGTAVHMDCHAYDDVDADGRSDLSWETVHPDVLPFVEAWATVRAQKGLTPVVGARERRLFHPIQWYTGILDGVFRRTDGRLVLGDLKTGDPNSSAAHLQTAAYKAAWELAHPDMPIDERWAIWLQPRLREPYRIVNYDAPARALDAWQDFPKFCAALAVYNEQPERRKRIA